MEEDSLVPKGFLLIAHGEPACEYEQPFDGVLHPIHSILQEAEEAHVPLPSECEGGIGFIPGSMGLVTSFSNRFFADMPGWSGYNEIYGCLESDRQWVLEDLEGVLAELKVWAAKKHISALLSKMRRQKLYRFHAANAMQARCDDDQQRRR